MRFPVYDFQELGIYTPDSGYAHKVQIGKCIFIFALLKYKQNSNPWTQVINGLNIVDRDSSMFTDYDINGNEYPFQLNYRNGYIQNGNCSILQNTEIHICFFYTL